MPPPLLDRKSIQTVVVLFQRDFTEARSVPLTEQIGCDSQKVTTNQGDGKCDENEIPWWELAHRSGKALKPRERFHPGGNSVRENHSEQQ